MTEAEWRACTDPATMLESLRSKASERKLRLFAVACCRRIWPLLTDERSRRAVECAELYADGLIDEQKRLSAVRAAINATWDLENDASDFPAQAACLTADPAVGIDAVAIAHYTAATEDERAAQVNLLREQFGNPFRPVTVDPIWLTSTVVSLAQGIYDERAFDRLPILADALEDAGCTDAEMLNHCRQPGEHVRGCWLVDLVLQKS
jgi:hypothetical protein